MCEADICRAVDSLAFSFRKGEKRIIDIHQDELDEAPTEFEKILMDATHLDFKDNSFDHNTFSLPTAF